MSWCGQPADLRMSAIAVRCEDGGIGCLPSETYPEQQAATMSLMTRLVAVAAAPYLLSGRQACGVSMLFVWQLQLSMPVFLYHLMTSLVGAGGHCKQHVSACCAWVAAEPH